MKKFFSKKSIDNSNRPLKLFLINFNEQEYFFYKELLDIALFADHFAVLIPLISKSKCPRIMKISFC
jgi:hypothetical protein